MKYKISYQNPQKHLIDIELTIDDLSSPKTIINLPSWRPGRYELANFAKNIVKFSVSNNNNEILNYQKLTKDSWEIENGSAESITIKYSYYANQLNAGATFLDENQLYINPVNCFIYHSESIAKDHVVDLVIPADYKIATSLSRTGHKMTAKNFDELADSPFIASSGLKHHSFSQNGAKFHLWFMGECKPDFEKLEKTFKPFIEVQFNMMKGFPFKEYHFMYQIMPYFFYHGVEHLESTVCALGPSYEIMEDKMYDELMGVSSHELFHSWNIKSIRPTEMMPYDFSKENYSKLGYVAEGVTTYYGDLFLYRSKFFNDTQYFALLSKSVNKYISNEGRNNMSVSEASFDTWLDGYEKGVPNRKVSIYNEGSMIAFILDQLIREGSSNKYSLDDVMLDLYENFGKTKKGYSESDYKKLAEKYGNRSFTDFFEDYVWGTKNLLPSFEYSLSYFGLKLDLKASEFAHQSIIGIKVNKNLEVTDISPNSAAETAGITFEDKILSINRYEVQLLEVLDKWLNYFSGDVVTLHVLRKGIATELSPINIGEELLNGFKSATITLNQKNENYTYWSGIE